MTPSFIHLHLHTEYSLANGVVRVKPLVDAAVNAGMPAIAVTDQSNMFSMVKFYSAAIAKGIKPLVGVDLWVSEHPESGDASRLVILCMDKTGYLNLTRLVSRSYIDGQHRGIPILDTAWLVGHTDGLG